MVGRARYFLIGGIAIFIAAGLIGWHVWGGRSPRAHRSALMRPGIPPLAMTVLYPAARNHGRGNSRPANPGGSASRAFTRARRPPPKRGAQLVGNMGLAMGPTSR